MNPGRYHLIFLLTLVAINSAVDAQSTTNKKLPVIICHRGANRLAPENTFASALKAIEAGAGFVEMDVRKNREKELWVLHDPWLGRTSNGHGLMMFRKNAYLDTLSAGCWFGEEFCNEKIPRFINYMQWAAGRTNLYIDFKSGNISRAIQIVRDNKMETNVFIGFWTRKNVRVFRREASDMKLKMNAGSLHKIKRLKRLFDVNIVEIPKKKVDKDFIGHCHALGVQVMVYYKHDDPAVIGSLLLSGIDYLNINDLEGTMKELSKIVSHD